MFQKPEFCDSLFESLNSGEFTIILKIDSAARYNFPAAFINCSVNSVS